MVGDACRGGGVEACVSASEMGRPGQSRPAGAQPEDGGSRGADAPREMAGFARGTQIRCAGRAAGERDSRAAGCCEAGEAREKRGGADAAHRNPRAARALDVGLLRVASAQGGGLTL